MAVLSRRLLKGAYLQKYSCLEKALLTSGNNPNGGDSPAIYISIEYYLGELGYMVHFKLQSGSSVNYGMLERIAGLD